MGIVVEGTEFKEDYKIINNVLGEIELLILIIPDSIQDSNVMELVNGMTNIVNHLQQMKTNIEHEIRLSETSVRDVDTTIHSLACPSNFLTRKTLLRAKKILKVIIGENIKSKELINKAEIKLKKILLNRVPTAENAQSINQIELKILFLHIYEEIMFIILKFMTESYQLIKSRVNAFANCKYDHSFQEEDFVSLQCLVRTVQTIMKKYLKKIKEDVNKLNSARFKLP